MNQRNIEKLFQEKFKDFEPEVPKEIWQNIKAQLPIEKSKKNYFWYKISAFVAFLLLGFFMFNHFAYEIPKTNKFDDSSKSVFNPNESEKKSEKNNTISNTPIKISINEKNNHNTNPKNNTITQNQLVTKITSEKKLTTIENENLISKKKKPKNEVILSNNSKKSTISNTNLSLINNQSINEDKNNQSNPIEFDKNDLSNEKLSISENANSFNHKKDTLILDFAKQDSLKTFQSEEQTELSKTNEKNQNITKWQFSSLIAPIIINNLNNNSSINPILDNNEKRNYLSLSYGAFVQYQITSKLGIRTGISKINYIQETNNVNYTAKMDNQNSIFQKNTVTFLASNLFETQELALSKTNIGTLKQEINFLEFPIELNYLIIDKKLQFSVLGGGSLFILSNDYTILRTSENQIINLGTANNINQTHYSVNFGFGTSYPIFSKMRFHLQPTIRYQINTFNQYNNKPYYLGLFSGISFNF